MALNLDERYPGRANPKTLSYPNGSFKNRTSPTSKDGTYLEADWANDWNGFFQWLLLNAGVQANGAPDTAQDSQYADALFTVFADWLKKSKNASEKDAGVAKISSTQQAQEFTDDSTIITPKKLADAFSGSNFSPSLTGFQVTPNKIIDQWGTITLAPVGAFNPQTIAGVTWYTHYYKITLPIAYKESQFTVVATMAGRAFADQQESRAAFVYTNKTVDVVGVESLTQFTVSVTTTSTGWQPTIHWMSNGK